ncbi:MAG TPA: glucuronate isomerase [Streptosporangiaceae bacterium]|nr:glucuronate isomerase [Streptosporangiaceae bacterium]
MMDPDRLFPADPATRAIARDLYAEVRGLPLICPHGHVDPALLADDAPLPDPAALFVTPDHYLTRMLYSQGVPPQHLGVPDRHGRVQVSPREAWRTFCAHWYLFRGTPSRLWLEQSLAEIFGVTERLGPKTADAVYDELTARIAEPGYRPRALLRRFGIEVLATTDSPTGSLDHHAQLAADGWAAPGSRVIPTFRPDPVTDPERPGWLPDVARLGELTRTDTGSYAGYLDALARRREDFRRAGATATDHGHPTALTADLDPADAARLYDRLRRAAGQAGPDPGDAELFRAQMLTESARMSVDDGLVMQLHPGAVRNHDRLLYAEFGPDSGGDIPAATDYVHALRPLLDRFGDDPRLRLVLFTLDESAYSRELAPLAGVYPAVYLGPAWWFHDSPEGMRRYRELTTETAGFYNTVGFTDDTRAFPSIPVRHDVARRVDCGFLARLVAEHRLPADEAAEVARDLAYRLPKRAYRLDQGGTG